MNQHEPTRTNHLVQKLSQIRSDGIIAGESGAPTVTGITWIRHAMYVIEPYQLALLITGAAISKRGTSMFAEQTLPILYHANKAQQVSQTMVCLTKTSKRLKYAAFAGV